MLIPLRDIHDAQQMRIVRNLCREWMTNDQHEISETEQHVWWNTFDRASVRPMLYRLEAGLTAGVIGYGLARFMNARWWLSGGLLPEYRGIGYGKGLFQDLAAYVHGLGHEAWLTVFEDNLRARACYSAIGFIEEVIVVDGAPGARPLVYMVKERS